ncbi:MAG: deoxyguanosinetriphosphate triphosphohydrolase [Xanthomonadaceae bacterium]|nr:deoxyguanosinetriphosphate triphosphohydrolase [Xanthomonadaceae bacterium]
MTLAPYAAREDRSRGRRHPEAPPQGRGEFQRDRDRIVHSSAFRRLEYKTQVFVSHEGDLYRNRLTHSLEVAQIVRSLARGLQLNEDLSEAIALAHDLGHTPFGHAGQDALDDCMKAWGGFEHNAQSLRVVDELEDKYAEFPGLNLSFETREGILKHCSLARAATLGDVGERFIAGRQPGLEAQLTNIADQIAYNNHDIDDGLRAGILSIEQLLEVPLFARFHGEVTARYGALTPRQLRHETIRRMINALVIDLHGETARRLASANLPDIEAVRSHPEPLVAFSDTMRRDNRDLKRFLYEHLYRHHAVYRVMHKARRIVRELFEALFGDLRLLPPGFQAAALNADDDAGRARVVADYVAGMTDRYAQDEHARLYDLKQLR